MSTNISIQYTYTGQSTRKKSTRTLANINPSLTNEKAIALVRKLVLTLTTNYFGTATKITKEGLE